MRKTKTFHSPQVSCNKVCSNCEKRVDCQSETDDLILHTLKIECEGFYYVFQKLEKLEEVPKFNGDEVAYSKEIDMYMQRREELPFFMPAMVVNGAFAAELALKYLCFDVDKTFERIHDLNKLFLNLPDEHKQYLTQEIFAKASQNEETLKINLDNISMLFVDFRYVFEKSRGFSGFFNKFVHIVCDYVISLDK